MVRDNRLIELIDRSYLGYYDYNQLEQYLIKNQFKILSKYVYLKKINGLQFLGLNINNIELIDSSFIESLSNEDCSAL